MKKRILIIFCFFLTCFITISNYSQPKTSLSKLEKNEINLNDLDRKEYFIADVIEDENSYFLLLSKDMPKSKLEMTIDSSYALKKNQLKNQIPNKGEVIYLYFKKGTFIEQKTDPTTIFGDIVKVDLFYDTKKRE
ncbi:hypothetical protein [Carnobacterium maltaromaticum]|uniref:Uncharacterized protein n=1 Tax=Carnobacterium maltaromaticum LMA28 TaxID=1234679 RepID=K8E1E8_CARML|nr:hypothetical protein [Carnobacterium maltaromaticum]AOA03582.1 hypothetical protein BFC23_14185 [Carnobacterium maltaromaticum]KRN59799.1 hypothetical protein IV70_GL001591 [Carnobacterium maltaromaticum DSM 20342]MCI1818197.1 hypothetical protein [Carnobacterium maltaromaticum]CCO09622.2 hypothetical protein BN424_139 [Carnobacterium maltaromaticum LMA28]